MNIPFELVTDTLRLLPDNDLKRLRRVSKTCNGFASTFLFDSLVLGLQFASINRIEETCENPVLRNCIVTLIFDTSIYPNIDHDIYITRVATSLSSHSAFGLMEIVKCWIETKGSLEGVCWEGRNLSREWQAWNRGDEAFEFVAGFFRESGAELRTTLQERQQKHRSEAKGVGDKAA